MPPHTNARAADCHGVMFSIAFLEPGTEFTKIDRRGVGADGGGGLFQVGQPKYCFRP